MSLTSDILSFALSLGFDRAATVPVGPPRHAAQFAAWLAAGYHGEMGYLAARAAERLDPARLAPDAASMIVLAVNYNSEKLLRVSGMGQDPASGRIARYARRPDYHETLKPKLYALDAFIRARTGRAALGKAFVDSVPVLERDFAEQARLGFIGRNTCLITPGLGSWTFLAGLLVPEVLTAGQGDKEIGRQGCGRCTRCLEACPTQAFVGPHVLDARRCISYLTIELRGPIPGDLRPLMGNWVFGCDVCQEVCPYNRLRCHSELSMSLPRHAPANDSCSFRRVPDPPEAGYHRQRVDGAALDAAQSQRRVSFGRDSDVCLQAPDGGMLALSELLTLDEAGFRSRFRDTPVMRAKRRGLVRNACVAAGNSNDPALTPALIGLLADPEPLVRGHAAWALSRIGGSEAARARAHAGAVESDPWVRSELACF